MNIWFGVGSIYKSDLFIMWNWVHVTHWIGYFLIKSNWDELFIFNFEYCWAIHMKVLSFHFYFVRLLYFRSFLFIFQSQLWIIFHCMQARGFGAMKQSSLKHRNSMKHSDITTFFILVQGESYAMIWQHYSSGNGSSIHKCFWIIKSFYDNLVAYARSNTFALNDKKSHKKAQTHTARASAPFKSG